MADAAYYREYRRRIKQDPKRAAHYGAVDRVRKRRNRAIPGWRVLHEPDHRCRAAEPIPSLHLGHPLFEQARQAVPDTSTLIFLRDALPEDLRSEYVLAVLEGRDPLEAIRCYRSLERNYAFHCTTIDIDLARRG